MKKMSIVAIALSLAVSLFSMAYAGMDGGCGSCVKQGGASDPYRKFQADTIDLRQEMMVKRFEVQRENLKAVPDSAKVASLQAEIKALQAKILEMRAQSGLPTDKCDGECGQKSVGCNKMNSDCGKGKGMGGCNSGPCGSRK